MSLTAFYDNSTDLVAAYGLAPSTVQLPQRAENGEAAFGLLPFEDPTAGLTLTGHRPIWVAETECSQPRLFTGWVVSREFGRSLADGLIVADDRLSGVNIVDANAGANFIVISGDDGNRPEETWNARLAWLVASDYLSPFIGGDTTYFGSYTQTMDAADYRGSYAASVLDDLKERTGGVLNWFLFWNPDTSAVELFIKREQYTIGTCPLTISNVLADIDGSITFAADTMAKLQREPDLVYSEVIVTYGDDGRQVYRSRESTATEFTKRGTTISRPYTQRESTAISQADQWLAAHSYERDRITCVMRSVPAASVGLVRAGMGMMVRMSHMPGYEAEGGVEMRIVMCSPVPTNDVGDYYDIALELVGSQPLVRQSAAFDRRTSDHFAAPELLYETTPGNLLVALVANGDKYVDTEPSSIKDLNGDETWNTAVAWTTAFDETQYGGPGGVVGVGIYWRRVGVGETSKTPIEVNTDNTEGCGVWLWELATDDDPGSGYAFTTDPGTLANNGSGYGPPAASQSISTGLSGFVLGIVAIQQEIYEWNPILTPTGSAVTLLNGTGENRPWYDTTGWVPQRVWLATHGDGGPFSFTLLYDNHGYSVVTGWGVAGAFIELPGVSSVPTIPWPANQVDVAEPGGGSTPTGGAISGPINPSTTLHTTDPTVTDDEADGYAVGDIWINTTTDDIFILVDATDGAAIWMPVLTGGETGTSPFYNVTDYGAVGDGLTDDTTAIEDAIAAADATNGGTIYFPPGTYSITTTITLTGQNYHLLGTGSRYGPSRIAMATANTTALSFAPSGSTALRTKTSLVENLVISGPGGASSGRGIDATNDLHVENCFVYGFYDGIYLRSESYYSYIAHSTFTDCDRAGLVLDSTNNTTVDTCRFTGAFSGSSAPIGTLKYGIYIGCTFPTGLNTRIINTSIEYFTDDGIYASGLFGGEISGCYFESQQSSSGHAHINLGPSNAAKAVAISSSYFQGDGTSGFLAILGGTTDRITVESCYFGVNSAIGIDASAGTNTNWLLVNNVNSPAGTFSLPASSYTLDPANPPATVGTPALTLGTANAAGSATTAVRTDATIAVFDATVPSTQAFGDAAATGLAAVAARRDHKHAMPAEPAAGTGPLLISDTPSTPLVFADLLQNEAQDDLLYADP